MKVAGRQCNDLNEREIIIDGKHSEESAYILLSGVQAKTGNENSYRRAGRYLIIHAMTA